MSATGWAMKSSPGGFRGGARDEFGSAKKRKHALTFHGVSLMNKMYLPTVGPQDWQKLLADPEKQWRRVAEAMKDPEDTLIVEGFRQLDAQTGSIAVFATNTTTRKLQQAQRQTRPAQAASDGQ